MTRLDGRVAIVTGVSPNIGGALARGLAAEGARVVCTSLTRELADECVQSITASGGDACAVIGDVSDADHADDAVAEALRRWGRVDILVNNAVWFNPKGLLDGPYQEYERQLHVILGGAFLFTRAAAKAMIDRSAPGSVINVLSTAAWQGQPGNLGYCTGKSGLINFTKSVAMELAPFGIRVNGFTPTATRPSDPRLAAQFDAATTQPGGRYRMDFRRQLPLDRLPTPEDYVPAVVFLASDDSQMMTGTNITVDAGATAKYWPWTPHSQ